VTDDKAKARDEHMISALAVVLVSGFSVESEDGSIRVEHRADAGFVVKIQGDIRDHDEAFEQVRDAVNYFLDLSGA
jgi:hypothetical protein